MSLKLLDTMIARYLAAHPGALPSNTTVLELAAWLQANPAKESPAADSSPRQCSSVKTYSTFRVLCALSGEHSIHRSGDFEWSEESRSSGKCPDCHDGYLISVALMVSPGKESNVNVECDVCGSTFILEQIASGDSTGKALRRASMSAQSNLAEGARATAPREPVS